MLPRTRFPRPARLRLVLLVLMIDGGPILAQDLAFRINDLDLRDPHVFVDVVGCRDLTDSAILGFSVNGQLQQRIQNDTDGDGQLDLSYLLEFLPLQLDQPTSLLDFGIAQCSAPLATTTCTPVQSSAIAGDANLQDSGICSAPVSGTTRPYAPPVSESVAACFVSPVGTVTLDVGGIPITLQQATVAGTWVGDPPDSIVQGLLRGFISESDADAAILPPTLPLIAGQPLSSILAGGSGNCAAFSDKDVLDTVPGWWFYLNFSAVRVTVVEPSGDVFRDGFESP
jgi:hypothetical protein